jgi:4-coumarate--CoA ligase
VVALAKHPLVGKFDLSALKQVFSGAAPLKADLAAECGKRLECEVVQGYGMTELSPVSHLTPPGWFKPGSVGVTAPNTQTRIVDPVRGVDLGIDEDGEICVRGPQVMKGYLNRPDATAATINQDGWLRTGDIGYADEDGHFYIVDRLKEMIKYKAMQVAPAELEAMLLSHPAVADAAVIPSPDEEAGEVPKAFVVRKADATDVTPEELMAYVAVRVAPHKKIRRLEFIEAVPKTASGKILRRVLLEQERARAQS